MAVRKDSKKKTKTKAKPDKPAKKTSDTAPSPKGAAPKKSDDTGKKPKPSNTGKSSAEKKKSDTTRKSKAPAKTVGKVLKVEVDSSPTRKPPSGKPLTEPEAISSAPSPSKIADGSKDPRMADPVFAELAVPKLPSLDRKYRAWLQIQSPTRLFFYWSLKGNPFKTLRKAFGHSADSYSIVVKLRNITRGWEEIHPVEAEGNWWFQAEPNCRYQGEVGFFAANRPFVRLVFSNTVETPRRSPSPRPSSDSEWAISSEAFARVLDNAGFVSDAFEVAMRGDDEALARERTRLALSRLVGKDVALTDFDAEEVRYMLLMLAAGMPLDELRGRISEALFLFMTEHLGRFSSQDAVEAIVENFDVLDEEFFEVFEEGAKVFGASLVHMPVSKRSGRRRLRAREFNFEGSSPTGSKKI